MDNERLLKRKKERIFADFRVKEKYMMLLMLSLFTACDRPDNLSSLEHDGETRQYLLYTPANTSGETMPLLLNLHGFDGTANEYMEWADMRELADANKFLLVYPQGADLKRSTHWNSSLPSEDNKSSTDDFGFLNALVDHLVANNNADVDRVYVGGYSNGGFMTYSLACYHSDKYAAIFAVSSTMTNSFEGDCAPTRPMPVFSANGSEDGVVPYSGNEYYQSQVDIMSYWKNHNNISAEAEVIDITSSIQRTRYSGGDNGSAVEHYRLEGGDHVWFSDDFGGSDLNTLVWNFVSSYDRNGLIE